MNYSVLSFYSGGVLLAQVGLSDLNSWVEARLAASGSVFVSGALLFCGGLLASLLPCVYPLYPITASIIRNRSEDSHRLLHPLAYYFGLVVVYASFGILAATFGGAFNAVLRLGITNISLSIVFALLALSTAGWLHLPLFQGRQVNVRPGVIGTVFLGGAAGMLSSACVGPVVVSILLQLAAASNDGAMIVNAAMGASQMMAFGMGVGVPFLCIALFGVALPKSGNWMLAVQYSLAAVIGFFAYVYLEKGLSILEFPEPAALTLMTASLVFASLVFWIQPEDTFLEVRIRRSVCTLGLVIAATVIFQTLQPRPALMATSAQMQSPLSAPKTEQDGNLTWYLDEDAAYEHAKREGKNVFIDFYGPWCTNCKAFQQLTLSNQELNDALNKSVLLKIYDRVPLFQTYKHDPRFPELKIGLPFFVITDSNRHLLYKTNDYLKTEEMLLFLNE